MHSRLEFTELSFYQYLDCRIIPGKLITCLLTVPSAPADIKAVVSSRNKILVSWLPPAAPNGVLVGYTLYMSVIEDGREVCF